MFAHELSCLRMSCHVGACCMSCQCWRALHELLNKGGEPCGAASGAWRMVYAVTMSWCVFMCVNGNVRIRMVAAIQ
jgi:hypothetical protein